MAELTFHGAAETVTGSKYLLAAGDSRVLIDCGLFQGLKELRLRNWAPLAFDIRQLDSIVLTHAHIDHIGFLPRVVQQGYCGPVYCTAATEDLAEIILNDSARCQEEDADYANRKGFSKHKPAKPLYDQQDVARSLRLLEPGPRETWFQAAGPIWCRYHDAGHLLGSAMIEVEIRDREPPLRILFSGDVGRYNAPLYHDPFPPPACDYLICESTYGDRDHPVKHVLDQVCEVTQEAMRRGGVMLIASFAVGRAQQLIYLLQVLAEQNRLPALPIYLDSPMAVDATQVFHKFASEHDLSELGMTGEHPLLDGHNVHLVRTQGESKRINDVRGPAVIIASSGMMTGGRILHHLRRRLPDPRNTVVLGGFMAEGTRGWALQQGQKYLKVFGGDVPVKAAIASMPSLSGHAGHNELIRWLEPLPAPKRVFLTHGEKPSALSLAEELRRTRGWNTCVPRLGEGVELL